MGLKQKSPVVLLFLFLFVFSGCKQAKYVPDGEFLYTTKKKNLFRSAKKSTIHFIVAEDSALVAKSSQSQIVIEDLYDLLKPQPNKPLKLFVYNRIDPVK
ncbi:MAG: hypothetical protein R3279_11865, partial [Putridiphycobacter sp.]|nr:hypothetical protein [Putridiphycobacter sp.]